MISLTIKTDLYRMYVNLVLYLSVVSCNEDSVQLLSQTLWLKRLSYLTVTYIIYDNLLGQVPISLVMKMTNFCHQVLRHSIK